MLFSVQEALDVCVSVQSVSVGGCLRVGECYFWGHTRRRTGEGVVYSLFPGCIVHPHPAKSWSSITRRRRKINKKLHDGAPNCRCRAGLDSGGEVV